MPLAARYGDPVATANHPDLARADLDGDQRYLSRLVEHNPLQAFVHYAVFYPVWAEQLSRRLVAGEWDEIEESLHDVLGDELTKDYTVDEIVTTLEQRSTFLSTKYLLATRFLAGRLNVEIDEAMLDWLAHRRRSSTLDGSDLNLAQFEAEQLAARHWPQ